ncbi:hypothetical protein BpHYR1_048967 [Brachionus plicatilis]|uniref:Uncharacterized protein n=1 Tax=Brachionus plicatilis TaxID=10195 RepID=A0A3M7PV11_BRAPC|nr:hypothetical protein BpHYR1_048967 [Brachionus plicatilis]
MNFADFSNEKFVEKNLPNGFVKFGKYEDHKIYSKCITILTLQRPNRVTYFFDNFPKDLKTRNLITHLVRNFWVTRLAAQVNGMRGNSVNPVNPIGQFFHPVSPENHTDEVVMYFYKANSLNIFNTKCQKSKI